ncbi:hypothetical protein ACIGO9_24765 [Nocardia asteroides]|uniref:DUF7373 family lipoprotein n=1 Tax=Nocardia asteroides TaxID=1824 RepID=UPI0037C9B20F
MRKLRLGSALLALGLTLSACGGGSDAEPPAPQIDVAKLDAGNNPTTPVDLTSTRVPTSGALREAIRIGAATPVAYQFDPRFVHATGYKGGRHLTEADPPYFSGSGIESKDFNAAIPGIVAGWESSANRRAELSAGRGVETTTLRFSTADQAKFAATELSNRTPGTARQIPGYADALAKVEVKKEPLPEQHVRAWLTRGDLLLFIDVSDPIGLPYDADADATVAQRFFDKQIDMLRSYTPTPLREIAALPLDTENLLSHTLPTETSKRPSKGTSSSAVYPLQAVLHLEEKPADIATAYADAGIDYVAFDTGSIYRARDAAAALRFRAAMDKDPEGNPDYAKVESPPNLPVVNCFNAKPTVKYASDAPPVCHGVIGRYAFGVSGTNLQDVYQRAAAQYKLLNGFN